MIFDEGSLWLEVCQSVQVVGISERLPFGSTTSTYRVPPRLMVSMTCNEQPSNGCRSRKIVTDFENSWWWVVCDIFLRQSRARLDPPVRGTPHRRSTRDQSDPPVAEGRRVGSWSGDPERNGDPTRRLDKCIVEQHIPALCARPMVRACGEASLARGSLLGAVYRRLCGVFPAPRRCSTFPGRSGKATREVRPHSGTGQDQAGRVWAVRAAAGGQARQEAPGDYLLSGLHAVLHAQPEGQLQGWDAHREVTLAAQPHVTAGEDAADVNDGEKARISDEGLCFARPIGCELGRWDWFLRSC